MVLVVTSIIKECGIELLLLQPRKVQSKMLQEVSCGLPSSQNVIRSIAPITILFDSSKLWQEKVFMVYKKTSFRMTVSLPRGIVHPQ